MAIALRRPMVVPHARLLTAGLVLLLAAIVAIPSLTRLSLRPAVAPPLPANGIIAFPPDASHIHRFDPTTGTRSLWLLAGEGTPTHLAWSPDGTRLAFAEEQPGGRATLRIECLPRPNDCVASPADTFSDLRVLRWAPDGTRLLVVSAEDSGWMVDLVPVDASAGVTERLDLGMSLDWATWHPDGRSILVKGTSDDGVPQLYRVPLDGDRTPQPILGVDTSTPLFAKWTASEYLWDPAYAPDGATIMYSTVVDLLPRQSSDSQNARVRMVDADGSNDRLFEISPDSNYEMSAGWSPDGSRVAIAAQRLDDLMLAIAPVDDPTKAILVGPDPAITQGEHIRWSPDGTTLLSWGRNGSAVLIDAATGAITPLEVSIPGEAAWQPTFR